MINQDLTAILYDFGAASYFSGMSAWVYEKIQNVEVLAFGNFLEEILNVRQIGIINKIL